MNVTAVIVTRGDLSIDDLLTLRKSILLCAAIDEVIVWDNSRTPKDVRVFGRYAGAMLAKNEYVYVQDDDCVVDVKKIMAAAVPGRVVCNVPVDRRAEYAGTGVTLIGWGSVFAKSIIMPSFCGYLMNWPQDELFERECDRLFSYVNKRRVVLVDAELKHLPQAHGADRMGREMRHRADMVEMRRRARDLDEAFIHSRERLGVEVV